MLMSVIRLGVLCGAVSDSSGVKVLEKRRF